MTGEEIIVTFKEPWYNDYTRRLYTQLSEQMIREEIERVHKEPMIKVTDNKEVKETVLAGLKRNKEKYGKKYCPCSLVRDEDTVCMCKEFREMEEGTCHCQLYVKTKD